MTDPTIPIALGELIVQEQAEELSTPWATPLQFWVLVICIAIIIFTIVRSRT